MRCLRRIAAVLLLSVLCPGVGEIAENIGYLLSHGHLAHTLVDEHHDAPPGPEHGCTGTFHICPCHTTPMTLLTSTASVVPTPRSDSAVDQSSSLPDSGLSGQVYRPPRIA